MRSNHAVFLAASLFCATSHALELLQPRPLQDDGFGSTANAATADHPLADDLAFVFGSKSKPDGKTVPVVWQLTKGSLTDIIEEIPIPSFAQGEAIGGAVFPNGDLVAVGNLRLGNVTRAVLWRKPSASGWNPPQPLAPNADESTAEHAAYCSAEGGHLHIAGSTKMAGVLLPVVFHFDGHLPAIEPLPVPPGASASGREILVDCTSWGNFISRAAAGWVADRQGRTRPVVWLETPSGWATFPSSLRQGDQGMANSLVILDQDDQTEVGRLSICGTLLRSGRTIGFAAQRALGSSDENYLLLPPLPGFENSAATDHYSLGDTATHEVGHYLGLSSNADGTQVATLWIADFANSSRAKTVAARQLLVDPTALSEIRALKQSGLLAGQVILSPGQAASAAVFERSGSFVPDSVQVASSATGSEVHREPDGLWHQDENELRIRTENNAVVIDLEFLTGPIPPFSAEDFRRCVFPLCGGFILSAHALSNRENPSGTLNVYAFDPLASEFTPRASFPLTATPQSINAFAWDSTEHPHLVDPATGAIKIRLEFIQDFHGPTALALDMARLQGTPVHEK